MPVALPPGLERLATSLGRFINRGPTACSNLTLAKSKERVSKPSPPPLNWKLVRYSSEKVRRIRPPPRSGTETMTIVGQLLPVYARPASTGDVASTGLEMLNEVTPGLGFVEPVVRPTGMLPHEKRQALYQCSAQ
jgi:hypothetical protein